jgi:ribosome-associated toxin RatA of RatAB toxin-antitoxin module
MHQACARLALAGSLFFASIVGEMQPHPANASLLVEPTATVTCRAVGNTEFVIGHIRVQAPAEKVWPILANPYEFEEKISPRFTTVQVLCDKKEMSVLRCKVDIGCLLPAINYTVQSTYNHTRSIAFRSIAGDFKDFRGSWTVVPSASGKSCDVTYSIYVVPGIPVPQWVVRQAVKAELPHTLEGLRRRVESVCEGLERPVRRTISAARSSNT